MKIFDNRYIKFLEMGVYRYLPIENLNQIPLDLAQ